MKITVIVPVYKVEKYLIKCVESIINQTHRNIEIILVDDGSPDQCPSICDELASKDSRILVVHKVNGGLSDARNAGLKRATGEYVLFVDSDDYIELDACHQFVSTMKKQRPDIVVGNAMIIEHSRKYDMKHNFNTEARMISGGEYLKKELQAGTMYMAAWLNLYKVSFLRENHLEFCVGLLHEDEEFTPRAFLAANSIIGTDIVFYNYLIREGSITTAKNKVKNAEHIMRILKMLEKKYESIVDIELRKMLNDSLVNKFLNTFQMAELYKKENSYLIDKKFLNKKAFTKKNKLRVLLFKFNKNLYYNINRIFKKVKHINEVK